MHSHLNVDHARPRIASPTSPPEISISRAFPSISIVPPIVDLLKQGAAVAIGVSGGKDSQAAAMATFEYLDRIGHSGPRLLIMPTSARLNGRIRSRPASTSLIASAPSSLSSAASKAG